MELIRGLGSLPIRADASAVTIGFFDGVHRGHQAVFRRTVDVAAERGLTPVALTFDRHPREIFAPGTEPPLLTSLERKAELIEATGIECLVVLEFTVGVSTWPPEQFVDRVLVEGLHAAHAIVGSNFTFAAGDLTWPTTALGRRYALDGRVKRGAGRGAGLGFPTANLDVPPRLLLPGEGIYAGKAFAGGRSHVAAISVGTNPTFGREPLHVEVHLLDFDGDLLGQSLGVEFWERLRDQARFDSSDDLARQIKDDVERTRALVR